MVNALLSGEGCWCRANFPARLRQSHGSEAFWHLVSVAAPFRPPCPCPTFSLAQPHTHGTLAHWGKKRVTGRHGAGRPERLGHACAAARWCSGHRNGSGPAAGPRHVCGVTGGAGPAPRDRRVRDRPAVAIVVAGTTVIADARRSAGASSRSRPLLLAGGGLFWWVGRMPVAADAPAAVAKGAALAGPAETGASIAVLPFVNMVRTKTTRISRTGSQENC